GKVYRDSNQNGAFDSNEPGATGMYVKLLQNGSVLQVLTPDSNGSYSFTGLRAGTYTVLQSVNNTASDAVPSVPSGSVQSDPASGGAASVTLAGGVSATVNFGQYATAARLSGKIFSDNGAGNVNALDGAQAGSEAPLAGLTVI